MQLDPTDPRNFPQYFVVIGLTGFEIEKANLIGVFFCYFVLRDYLFDSRNLSLYSNVIQDFDCYRRILIVSLKQWNTARNPSDQIATPGIKLWRIREWNSESLITVEKTKHLITGKLSTDGATHAQYEWKQAIKIYRMNLHQKIRILTQNSCKLFNPTPFCIIWLHYFISREEVLLKTQS